MEIKPQDGISSFVLNDTEIDAALLDRSRRVWPFEDAADLFRVISASMDYWGEINPNDATTTRRVSEMNSKKTTAINALTIMRAQVIEYAGDVLESEVSSSAEEFLRNRDA